MFQDKTNLNASPCTEGENRKKKRKKTHISRKKKPYSKQDHSKQRKRWDLNLDNPHLIHPKYVSDYIGPERLTKHLLGFLGKGKISDSISRLEKIMPENCKTRSKHDLDRVLKVSSNDSHPYSQDLLPHVGESNSYSQDGSISSSPSPDFRKIVPKSVSGDSRKQNSKFSVHVHADNSIISSGSSRSPFYNKFDETVFCREVITRKLHSAVSNANKVVFPNTSNQKQLIKELLHLKNQYYCSRKALPSSNNYESKQGNKNTNVLKSAEKNDFKLNPILTKESPIVKTIENMFPDSQDLSSISDSDSNVSNNSVSSHSNGISMAYDYDNTKNTHFMANDHDSTKLSVASSGREGSLKLIPSSPTSSSGSPVWAPKLSPVKFLPNSLPTPKLFYRQKMF